MKALKFIILIALAFYTSSLHAIEPNFRHIDTSFDMKGYAWIQSSDSNLLVNIPSPTLSDVKDQMYETQSTLTAHKSKLTLSLKEKEFSLKDGLITLILPGGILYAAAVKRSHIKAKNELLEITSRLDEINHDILNLVAYKQQSTGIMVARK